MSLHLKEMHQLKQKPSNIYKVTKITTASHSTGNHGLVTSIKVYHFRLTVSKPVLFDLSLSEVIFNSIKSKLFVFFSSNPF